MQIIRRSAVNYSEGRQRLAPEAIVLQMLNSDIEAAVANANDQSSKQSFHYLISRTGDIIQLVEDQHTAWHSPGAAQPSWRYLKQDAHPNLYTIGVGIEGNQGTNWDEDIYIASAWLIGKLCSKWNIELNKDRIIGVSQINKLAKEHNPGLAVNFKKLIKRAKSSLEADGGAAPLPGRGQEALIAELTKTIANLELRNAALEAGLSKQNSPKASSAELKELLIQNTRLAEEVYLTQQEKHKLDYELTKLQSYIINQQNRISLESFSISSLGRAIINKLLGIFR